MYRGRSRGRTDTGVVVVDVETTGISTGYHHRIVELAIVRVDADGEIDDEYCTLVNPGRDLGDSSQIHGLRARDLLDAPTFQGIAGDVLMRLNGSVVIGHNIRFDLDFLRYEYGRVGYELPAIPSLCTMQLARKSLGTRTRRLNDCCAALGLAVDGEHSALGDARATARLFIDLRETADMPTRCCEFDPWPVLESGGSLKLRGIKAPRQSYLAHLAESADIDLDEFKDSVTIPQYLNVLDRILEDRVVTKAEADELESLAGSWRMSAGEIRAAHVAYMQAVARAALADGIVSDRERRDIDGVAELLAIAPADLDLMLRQPRHAATTAMPEPPSMEGWTVCFTGALECFWNGDPITRDVAERLASRAGLMPQKSVNRKLDLLVVADPDSMSSKAQKARAYGTRVMAETAFFAAIGVDVS
ncbi:MAG: hypothetical protein GEU71_00430 [Actinobacteria bacterium]|nr:hypothetical protein [Actinomycetota bacterium]